MKQVKIGESLNPELEIWRYVSIEKYIDMLHTKTLYFSPLSFFEKSDPFDGYIPVVGLTAMASIINKQIAPFQKFIDAVTPELNKTGQSDKVKLVNDKIKESIIQGKYGFKKISSCIAVNCWFLGDYESEAMWKIYSDNGKGIALRSTIGNLAKALSEGDHEERIDIGRVKYFDFNDDTLSPKELVSDGHLVPLLKRKSYQHENEIRAFLTPKLPIDKDMTNWIPRPYKITISIDDLIKDVIVSPYASNLYESAVYDIGEKYGIKERTKKSKLLSDADGYIESSWK